MSEIWNPAYEVMLGGLITGAITLLAVLFERKSLQREKRESEIRFQQTTAFKVQMKIATAYNWVYAAQKRVSECFEEAAQNGADHYEPGVKVKPLLGPHCPETVFSSDELALLLDCGDRGLVDKLIEFQNAIGIAGEIVDAFNNARTEFSYFMADQGESAEWDGEIASVSLPAGRQHSLDARLATLNLLLNEVLESLDESSTRAKDMSIRTTTAINSMDGLVARRIRFK